MNPYDSDSDSQRAVRACRASSSSSFSNSGSGTRELGSQQPLSCECASIVHCSAAEEAGMKNSDDPDTITHVSSNVAQDESKSNAEKC